jgi:hypothetical protein
MAALTFPLPFCTPTVSENTPLSLPHIDHNPVRFSQTKRKLFPKALIRSIICIKKASFELDSKEKRASQRKTSYITSDYLYIVKF